MKSFGLALHNYADTYGTLPPGAVIDAEGTGHHSWCTALVPFMSKVPYYVEIDFNRPWNDPVNADIFRNPMYDAIIPGVEPIHDAQGFGLIHYSANQNLFFANSSTRLDDITDGTANTILLGEVSAGFSPWGKPGNWRDPDFGLRYDKETFGCPLKPGCHFVLADGSVKFFNGDVDPKVLKAMATPAGGEP